MKTLSKLSIILALFVGLSQPALWAKSHEKLGKEAGKKLDHAEHQARKAEKEEIRGRELAAHAQAKAAEAQRKAQEKSDAAKEKLDQLSEHADQKTGEFHNN